MAAVLQVHGGECDLAHHVDPAHRVVEFDAVEDRHVTVDHRDIAQMQNAVAPADETALPTLKKRGATRGMLTLCPRLQPGDRSLVHRGCHRWSERVEIREHYVQDRLGSAESA